MGWPALRSNGFVIDQTAWNEVVAALSAWGGDVNAGGHDMSALGWVSFYNNGYSGGVNGLLQVRGTVNANDLVQQWGLGGGVGGYVGLQLVKTADIGGDFSFRTYSAGGGAAPKIKFGNMSYPDMFCMECGLGRFGIGTTAPAFQAHIAGLGQDSLGVLSTSDGRRGGTLYIQDTGGNLYNGGAIVFGSSYGFWAGIKASIQNGGENTQGTLSFLVRTLSTDDLLSEAMRLYGAGQIAISSSLNIGGMAVAKARLDLGNNLDQRNVSLYDDGTSAWGLETNNNLQMVGAMHSNITTPTCDFVWRAKTYSDFASPWVSGTLLMRLSSDGSRLLSQPIGYGFSDSLMEPRMGQLIVDETAKALYMRYKDAAGVCHNIDLGTYV